MLERLKVTRFKSIRDQSLEFGKVNLFIGGNGTGKSNILEAIGLTAACLGRGLGDSDIGRKGLRITPPELMKSSFKNEDLPKTLKIEASFCDQVSYTAALQSSESDPLLRFFSEAAKHGKMPVFGRSHRGARATGVTHADRLEKHRGIWDQIKATYDLPDVVADVFSEFSRYVIFSPQTDFLRAKQSGRVDVPPVGLHGEGLPTAVRSFLKEWGKLKRAERRKEGSGGNDYVVMDECADLVWLPGWATAFGTHRANPLLTSREVADSTSDIVFFRDKFMHSKRNELSVYDSSEGTLFLLFAGIILSHPEAPKVFALDNVDNALNPKLTRQLVEQILRVVSLANEHETKCGARQVFLTSHNPTSLDAFDLFDDTQRVFVVRRNEKGHTTAVRLEPPKGMSREDWRLAMNGRNLSQIWLDGDIPGALGDL
ncbi:AAA family ATPase [Roseovarius sp.]|uniref:AAA family ATPase n=1 Tax=Roseovarius sp. TaxID=1486281 RepID=UPI003D104A02